MKTRQQPFEACVATKTNVTPAGSALGSDSGSDPSSVAGEVQARSETDITKEGSADLRNRSMPTILEACSLEKYGYRLITGPESVFVSMKNRLGDGEFDHAAAWGTQLAEHVSEGGAFDSRRYQERELLR